MTDLEVSMLVIAAVGVLNAVAIYLQHMSTAKASDLTNTKVDAIGTAVNGQAAHLQAVTTQLQTQADVASKADPPIDPAILAMAKKLQALLGEGEVK